MIDGQDLHLAGTQLAQNHTMALLIGSLDEPYTWCPEYVPLFYIQKHLPTDRYF